MTTDGFYFDIAEFSLASSVANAGTVTVGYPTKRSKGNYEFANSKHKLILNGNVYSSPADFTLTFNANASNITLTNKTGATWPASATCKLQLNLNGRSRGSAVAVENPARVNRYHTILVDLGSPNVADADGICAAQAVAGAGAATINGALASGGVATLDVPRGVVIVSSNAGDTSQVITLTGTDEYGTAVRESITANGTTSVPGKKAFKTVSSVTSSAAFTGNLTVGTTDVLGLPIAVTNVTQLLKESQDGTVPTAGTLVVALQNTESTATTADVRGTYDPNAAADGNRGFALLVAVPDPSDIGVAQYAG